MRNLGTRLLLTVCALICPALAFAQGGVPASPIQFTSSSGRPLAGATVTVCTSTGTGFPCTPLASIFTDAGLTISSANPVTTDGNGNLPVIFAAPGVYKLSVTGSGITSTLVTATVAGTGGGNVILNANNAFTGNNTHSGTETFTGTETACQLNSVLYVGGSITCWAGADIGAQINTAYAALPSTGGTIYILGGNYSFTTPIVLATSGKPAILAGVSPGGVQASPVVLNYTPTTATTAIRLDFSTPGGAPTPGAGLRDFALWNNGPTFTVGGSGSSATGISFGPTNHGDILGSLQNLWVGGFGTGISWPTSAIGFGVRLWNCSVMYNNTGMSLNGQENVGLFGGYLTFNGTAISSNGGEVTGVGLSIDDNTATAINYTNVAGVPTFKCSGCHFETGAGGNGAGAGTVLFITGTADVTLDGGMMLDDYAVGNATAFISASGNNLHVYGTEFQTSGQTFTQPILLGGNVSGEIHAFNQSPTVLPSDPTSFVNAGAQGDTMVIHISPPVGANVYPFQFSNGGFSVRETNTNPNAAANTDICKATATAHALQCSYNNGSFSNVPLEARANTLTAINSFPGNTVALTADWTCGTAGTVASCVAATIIGSGGGVPLTFTLPLATQSYTLECDGVVGQATAATANQWNLLTATNGATNVTANYSMATAATSSAFGAVTDQASTTATFQIAPSWTLGGVGTKMPFHVWAKIEGASASGTVVSLQLVAPTVGDLVTIYRGAACRVF